jgi:hypothetical protein
VVEKRTAERLANINAHNTRTKVVDVQFAIGDFVLVGVADSSSRPRHVPKLAVRWQGPCRVIRLDPNTTYEVENLVDGSLDVFHYSQIRIYSDDSLHISELLTTAIASNEQRVKEYKIEKLLDLHFENKTWQVQVQWSGYRTPTWEPADTIHADVPQLFQSFLKTIASRKRARYETSRNA